MTLDQFRRLALTFPEASESAHMNHPDFRVAGKIFATLGYPDDEHGMVILPPDEQKQFVRAAPEVFAAAKGAWGKRGSTTVYLRAVDKATLKPAMKIAWRNKAPKDLLESD